MKVQPTVRDLFYNVVGMLWDTYKNKDVTPKLNVFTNIVTPLPGYDAFVFDSITIINSQPERQHIIYITFKRGHSSLRLLTQWGMYHLQLTNTEMDLPFIREDLVCNFLNTVFPKFNEYIVSRKFRNEISAFYTKTFTYTSLCEVCSEK